MRVELELKYVQCWTDHRGRKRFRFRRRGYPRIELPTNADPRSPEFQAAYHAALAGRQTDAAVAAVTARGGSGTVNAAIMAYLASTTFNDNYSPSTRSARRPLLNSVSRLVGTLPLAKMDTNWVTRWLETAPTKIVKATRLGAIRPFLQWAIGVGLITVDPTVGIKVKVTASNGHATWTDEQIEQFRACHPIGARARLALELLLAVAARRGDAIALGRQHLRDGCLVFVQQKNRKRKPVTVEAPVPPRAAGRPQRLPERARGADILDHRVGPAIQREGLQHPVPRVVRRGRVAAVVQAPWPAQGGLPHHGRERLHRARDQVDLRPSHLARSRALYRRRRQQAPGHPRAGQGGGRQQRRAAGGGGGRVTHGRCRTRSPQARDHRRTRPLL